MLMTAASHGSVVTGGEDTLTSGGTSVACGNGTKGTAVTMIDPLPFVGGMVEVFHTGMDANEILVDVMIEDSAGGNAQVLIPDLLFQKVGGNDNSSTLQYCVPIRVPKGAEISVRGLSDAASVSLELLINVYSISFFPTPFTKCIAYGAGGASTARGTTVTTSGTADTNAYTQISASTSIAHRAFFCGFGRGTIGTWAAATFQTRVVVGGSGQLRPATPWMGFGIETTEDGNFPAGWAYLSNVPASSEIGMQHRADVASVAMDTIVYGLS